MPWIQEIVQANSDEIDRQAGKSDQYSSAPP